MKEKEKSKHEKEEKEHWGGEDREVPLGVDVNHSSHTKSEPEKPPEQKPLPADMAQAVQSAGKLIPTSPKLLDYPEVSALMLKAADYSTRQLMARSPGMTAGEALLAVVSQLLVGYPDTVSQVTGNQPVTLPDA